MEKLPAEVEEGAGMTDSHAFASETSFNFSIRSLTVFQNILEIQLLTKKQEQLSHLVSGTNENHG